MKKAAGIAVPHRLVERSEWAAPAPESLGSGLLDLLKRAAEASLVFAALLYVIGWSYLDGYYAAFGLKVGQLGVSTQEAAISSFRFIFHSVVTTISICLGVLIVGSAAGYLYRRLQIRRELTVAFFLIALLGAAGLLSQRASIFGRAMAWNDMSTATTTLPRVEAEVDRAKLSDNIVHYSELESKAYRLLLQAENRVWLFKSVDDVKGVFSVVTLPKEAVRVIAIERPTPKGEGK
jgi:hypothetical protein